MLRESSNYGSAEGWFNLRHNPAVFSWANFSCRKWSWTKLLLLLSLEKLSSFQIVFGNILIWPQMKTFTQIAHIATVQASALTNNHNTRPLEMVGTQLLVPVEACTTTLSLPLLPVLAEFKWHVDVYLCYSCTFSLLRGHIWKVHLYVRHASLNSCVVRSEQISSPTPLCNWNSNNHLSRAWFYLLQLV